ncbi:MAG: hypothetical protein ACP5O3_00175 [Candidatus Micrarchaeia archaeon]|jgi:hypothetical protein
MKCERCGSDAHVIEACDYCGRKVCRACIKSSRTVAKTIRRVICKDCWTNTKKRKEFKSEQNPARAKKQFGE